MRKTGCRRWLAMTLAGALCAGMLGGCGKEGAGGKNQGSAGGFGGAGTGGTEESGSAGTGGAGEQAKGALRGERGGSAAGAGGLDDSVDIRVGGQAPSAGVEEWCGKGGSAGMGVPGGGLCGCNGGLALRHESSRHGLDGAPAGGRQGGQAVPLRRLHGGGGGQLQGASVEGRGGYPPGRLRRRTGPCPAGNSAVSRWYRESRRWTTVR